MHWKHCWDAPAEFDFKAVEARFRKEGLRVLGRLFEALIHSNPLRLLKGAPCLHCGIGSLAPNG